MLHRKTNNKIVVILVYAFLEWILILLLLLNSLFSYFITKFAKFFGLKPPCIFCSRLDHVLQPENSTDLVCETHAAEISNLGYCPNHQRLSEVKSMCENCLASRPNHHEVENLFGLRHKIGFISLASPEKHDENGESLNRCSCCNECLKNQFYPPWDDRNYLSKGCLIVESIEDDDKESDKYLEFEINNGQEHVHDHDHDHDDEVSDEHQILFDIESFILREVAEDRSSSVSNLNSDEKDAEKDDPSVADSPIMQVSHCQDRSLEIINKHFEKKDDPSGADNFIHPFSDTPIMKLSHLEDRSIEIISMNFENYVACGDDRLTPVKLIDSITCVDFESCKLIEDPKEGKQMIQTFASELPVEPRPSILEGEVLLSMDENVVQTLEVEGLNQISVVQTSVNDDNSIEAVTEEPDNAQVDLFRSQEPICSYECTEEDESESSDDDDAEAQNAFEKFISQNKLSMSRSLSNDEKSLEADMEEQENTSAEEDQSIPEDQSSTSDDDIEVPNAFDEFIANNNLYTDKIGVNDNEIAEKTTSFENVEEETIHQSSKCPETCEVEEDKLPETPTSADAMLYMHRKLMLYEKRESGAEESVDGSVASEVESGDPVLTIDRLKTALKNEQRALSVIYQELEEERSASAIATNQTMAMITRLQEEKAAMQMEALQYQRMMEEQAEYDQEALQLLNDLMTKREREKQELEKELEEYREKVMEYEAKEKLSLLRRMKDGSVRSRDSSCSCCNTGYTDELSIDLNNEEKEDDNNENADDSVSKLEEMALDCVKHVSELDSTLEEFEEEKASILDQLKALEEKIVSLEDGEEFLEESSSRYGDKEDYSNGCLAKKLLPYLDEADNENDEEAFAYDRELENGSNDMQMQNTVPIISEMDSMKVCIEEEVDRVYDRLQALETDREFLQHCMGSIQNGGDEGKDLLQEILQHLRDLKNVELRLKDLDNDPSSIVMLHSPSKDL
ncbi:unnamed protein product [Trifolium pratense]|uniref:Uncharacterized protein n=1 Tax=Trifolium pratense TaxID=57577 RepID=A0ACB0LCJ9_TRIPR|nr:unnamed protein product [Trifolium pratense]